MIINQDQNTSSSLQIVQPENHMTFTSNDSSKIDQSYDKDLSYSKDQSSFSIRIEDQSRNTLRQSYGHSYLNNQPPKRIRREIFDKYKTHVHNSQETKNVPTYGSGENDIMRAFDQIFSLSTPKNVAQNNNQSTDERKIFERKSYVQKNDNKIRSDQKKQSISQFNSLKTPQKKQFILTSPTKVQSEELSNSMSFFKTPLDYSTQKKVQAKKKDIIKDQHQDLYEIQNRVSFIKYNGFDLSRDSGDLSDILNAQIFQDKQIQASTKVFQPKYISPIKQQVINIQINEPKEPFSKKVQGAYQQKPFITPPPARELKQKNNIQLQQQQQYQQQQIQQQQIQQMQLEKQRQRQRQRQRIEAQNMQQSRVSDVYQKIDMSQSIANSVVIKDPRIKIFDPNYHNFNNFNSLGAFSLERNNSLKNFSRSGSSGFLNIQEDNNTIINTLGSLRMIQQASQQQRISIFLRKAIKLNSVIPNFHHPSYLENIDEENKKLQQLVNSFDEAIKFLQDMSSKIQSKSQKKKQVNQLFSSGITVSKFQSSNWESCMILQGLDKLRPKQNLYAARQWKPSRVQQALKNYRQISQSHKGIRINLKDQRGITKYFQIRKKYWDIQKNILMITQDMYNYIMCLGFPKHYDQFKKILQENELIFDQREVRCKKIQLEQIKRLRNKNQELSSSQVGTYVMMKLAHQIKYNSTNF